MTNQEEIESLQRALTALDKWQEQVMRVTRLRARCKLAQALARDYNRMTKKLVAETRDLLLLLITLRSEGIQ